MREKRLVRGLIFFVGSLFASLISATVQADQGTQPKFSSGGIEVAINRATAPDRQGEFVISLIVSNLGDDSVNLMLSGTPQAITDKGGLYDSGGRVSGMPVCHSGFALVLWCEDTDGSVLLEAGNSATVTLGFRGPQAEDVCSVDFSMDIFFRRSGEEGSAMWRRASVGLPNIKVC